MNMLMEFLVSQNLKLLSIVIPLSKEKLILTEKLSHQIHFKQVKKRGEEVHKPQKNNSQLVFLKLRRQTVMKNKIK